MNYVFQNVDKAQITTGILRDYGIEFLNLDNYQGSVLHDSNYVALDDWRMLYTGLYSSQITSSANMLYLDTVNRLIRKYNYSNMPITFIGLDYNYNKIRDDAVSGGLMYVSNDQLFDVNGRSQSPYEQKELFALAPIRQAAFTGSTQFIFRPELFLKNTGKVISSIAYDAAGGTNYQTIAFNTPFTLSYANSGFYDFNIRITYTDNSIRYGHTKIVVYQNPDGSGARYGTRPVTNETAVATKAYQNIFASGDITIDLAANNTTGQIRKPLIVVEGFDPDGGFTYFNEIVPRISFDLNFGFPNFFLHPITLNDGLGWVYVRRQNQCGYSSLYSVFVTFDPWCGNYYTISPNPATNNITVDGQKQKRNIKEVQIIDKTGQVRKTAKFGNNVQRVNLDISGLAPDIYYIKVFDGKAWKSKPIIVQ